MTNSNLVEGIPNKPVSGAIEAIAASPTNPDLVYVGTVNGGIWKTTNATSANPTWTPLSDQQLPALSINSLAISPVDPNTLFAGTGSVSSDSFFGNPGFGVARSVDGGANWTVATGLPATTFAGQAINSIVPTSLSSGQVILAATLATTGGGVFRSTDNGVTFARVSGKGFGLPDAGVSQVVGDASDPNVYYAGVPQGSGGASAAGVYRSQDGGQDWALVNGSGATGLTGLSTSLRILLSVHGEASPKNVVYASIIDQNGTLSGVFFSTDQGGTWTSLGDQTNNPGLLPSPPIYPGKQGNIHGVLLADKSNPNVVFISGDTQACPSGQLNCSSPFATPNPNGCFTFSSNSFRADTSTLPSNPWQPIVCNGANGTSPHSDSRALAFDANLDLLLANDGGIYRLQAPNSSSGRQWVSVIGNIRVGEFHSVAYDELTNVAFGGAQDNGTSVQTSSGSATWNQFQGGDGGVVAVDNDQGKHAGTTFRYSSLINLAGFQRTTWDTSNALIGTSNVGLNIVSGSCTGSLFACDTNEQFYNPVVLNAIDPSRMLIGTADIYESISAGTAKAGDQLTDLGFIGQFIGCNGFGRPMAYGGRLSGAARPDVFYVGTRPTTSAPSPQILHRTRVGGSINNLAAYAAAGGSSVCTIAVNPHNYRQVYVVDGNGRIWASSDEGASWHEITGNLGSLSSQVATIELFSTGPLVANTVVIAGGFGVFQLKHLNLTNNLANSWTPLSTGMANALVQDLHYDYPSATLVAGTLGRGAWKLGGFFPAAAVAAASPEPTGLPEGTVVEPFTIRLPSGPGLATPAAPGAPAPRR